MYVAICTFSQKSDHICYITDFIAIKVILFYFLTGVVASLERSFIIMLSAGLGGMAIFFVITIAVSVYIQIKSRKNVLSQKVDTQHYIKPPAG